MRVCVCVCVRARLLACLCVSESVSESIRDLRKCKHSHVCTCLRMCACVRVSTRACNITRDVIELVPVAVCSFKEIGL